MGKRGPAKTPTAILRARGSWLAKTRPDQSPADAGIPDPPPWLKESARAEWNFAVSLLGTCGVLTRRDRTSLAAYCHSVADWLEAEADIAANGLDQFTEAGLAIPRPAVGRRARAWDQMLKMGARFGLTPSDRANAGDGKETKDDKKARFFAKSG